MPKGPNGEKRPADTIGLAVHVARIATGEIEDAPEDDEKDNPPNTPPRAFSRPARER